MCTSVVQYATRAVGGIQGVRHEISPVLCVMLSWFLIRDVSDLDGILHVGYVCMVLYMYMYVVHCKCLHINTVAYMYVVHVHVFHHYDEEQMCVAIRV